MRENKTKIGMSKSTPPISIRRRNSSIELYRIIATFAVIIVHFNGWFVGSLPESFDVHHLSSFRIGQTIIEAATCICVNMFLIISGYFGLRLKWESVIKICLLLLFIYIPFYLFTAVYKSEFEIRTLIRNFFVITKSGYFIQCYLMLIFLSPALNSFIDKYERKLLLKWTIVFLSIEFWFGGIMKVEALGFNKGYSVIHFVLMYMIARCLFLYKTELTRLRWWTWGLGYLICTVVISLMYIAGVKYCWDYSNPVVVASSICSFIPFIYYNYENKIINWIAKSTLAVYIIQCTDPVYSFIVKLDNSMLEANPYFIYLLESLLVIVVLFFLCILYDKLCGIAIKPLSKCILQYINSKSEKIIVNEHKQ